MSLEDVQLRCGFSRTRWSPPGLFVSADTFKMRIDPGRSNRRRDVPEKQRKLETP